MVKNSIIVLLLSVGLLVSFPAFAPVYKLKASLKTKSLRELSFSPLRLRQYLDSRRGELPDQKVVYAQAALETGYFTSIKCVRYNNLFGLKKAKYRPTTATGTYRHSATYKHWTHSVDDYILRYQYFKQFCSDTTNYYGFLRKTKYCMDRHYERNIKLIIKRLK
jgi:hypothetical protein